MRLFNVHISVICVIIYSVSAVELEKRGRPLGFTGVRGKKTFNDETPYNTDASSASSEDTSYTTMAVQDTSNSILGGNIDKRAPSGFFGMRGKKPYEEFTPDFPMVYYKRAPSGFFGMRGKKEFDDYDKRAPSGFMGMRGKKAPSGFFGMRGKKSYDDSILIDEDKRAPPSGFFGMRGKKQPARSGFFGMRGKKYPYEFRGKFVGVRGKKMYNDFETNEDFPSNFDEDVTRLGQNLDLNQLMLLLTENNNENNNGDNNNGYYNAQD